MFLALAHYSRYYIRCGVKEGWEQMTTWGEELKHNWAREGRGRAQLNTWRGGSEHNWAHEREGVSTTEHAKGRGKTQLRKVNTTKHVSSIQQRSQQSSLNIAQPSTFPRMHLLQSYFSSHTSFTLSFSLMLLFSFFIRQNSSCFMIFLSP